MLFFIVQPGLEDEPNQFCMANFCNGNVKASVSPFEAIYLGPNALLESTGRSNWKTTIKELGKCSWKFPVNPVSLMFIQV